MKFVYETIITRGRSIAEDSLTSKNVRNL